MTVIDWTGTNGKMIIIDGVTGDGLDYSMEVHLKRSMAEQAEEETEK